jgi:hypothetical protein
VSGIGDPFNGHIDAFRTLHVQRSDSWIETTWTPWPEPRSSKAGSRHRWQALVSLSA